LTGQDIVVSSVFEVNCSPCVSSVGDSNGDGYEDLVVGADGHDTTGATNKGAAYLVLGASSLPNGSAPTLSVAQVYGSISSDFAGRAVGGGDFDGNGYGDMLVGASGFDSPLVGAASNTGAAVIIYGPATGSYSVSALSGSNYAAWLGSSSSGNLGAEVGGVGDLNADGFDDWFLGAPNYNPGVRVGQGYLFYGVGQ
ncbi:MAG TPA: integrin alpha, partial [Myxococcota bacterium]|nr:integrin alpha [Myxococcota bacterium]